MVSIVTIDMVYKPYIAIGYYGDYISHEPEFMELSTNLANYIWGTLVAPPATPTSTQKIRRTMFAPTLVGSCCGRHQQLHKDFQ